MKIVLGNVGKRFNREWVFRNVNYEFSIGNKYAILGTNGSGKSTLLQIIAGSLYQSEGEIKYIAKVNFPACISLAAPYLELSEEMTLAEAVTFHGKFKKFVCGFSEKKIIELSGLLSSAGKQLRNFSSGMNQRVQITLAVLSDTPLLLLDEPATNLDENGVKWYQHLIAEFTKEKLVIVCSNYNNKEYSFCGKELELKSMRT